MDLVVLNVVPHAEAGGETRPSRQQALLGLLALSTLQSIFRESKVDPNIL